MCLAVPRKIVRIIGEFAELSDGRRVRISSLQGSKVGEYVLVQGDMVLQKVESSQVKNLIEIAKSLKIINKGGRNG